MFVHLKSVSFERGANKRPEAVICATYINNASISFFTVKRNNVLGRLNKRKAPRLIKISACNMQITVVFAFNAFEQC